MSRTDKDQPYMRKGRQHYEQPPWWRPWLRRYRRTRAAQDLRNGREPAPFYRGDRDWW